MEKKYEFTGEEKFFGPRKLHRIKALKNFRAVRKGEVGGWIEKEENLSHEGACWVFDEAKVFENAKVFDNAIVENAALVFNNAEVYGKAKISERAEIFGSAKIYNGALVCEDARVFGQAQVFHSAVIRGHAEVNGKSCAYDHCIIAGSSIVNGSSKVYGNAQILDKTIILEHAKILEDAIICGKASAHGDTQIAGDVILDDKMMVGLDLSISSSKQLRYISSVGDQTHGVTFAKNTNNDILVFTYWFEGSIDVFEQMIREGKCLNGIDNAQEYLAAIEYVRKCFQSGVDKA